MNTAQGHQQHLAGLGPTDGGLSPQENTPAHPSWVALMCATCLHWGSQRVKKDPPPFSGHLSADSFITNQRRTLIVEAYLHTSKSSQSSWPWGILDSGHTSVPHPSPGGARVGTPRPTGAAREAGIQRHCPQPDSLGCRVAHTIRDGCRGCREDT